jgi:predicted  nucleic acid-binding Zn-ribbon protein
MADKPVTSRELDDLKRQVQYLQKDTSALKRANDLAVQLDGVEKRVSKEIADISAQIVQLRKDFEAHKGTMISELYFLKQELKK